MARSVVQVQSVYPLEICNAAASLLAKRMLPIEGMKHDALQQITERHIMVFGQALQHLEQTLFQPDASLNSINDDWFASQRGSFRSFAYRRILLLWTLHVQWYICTMTGVKSAASE